MTTISTQRLRRVGQAVGIELNRDTGDLIARAADEIERLQAVLAAQSRASARDTARLDWLADPDNRVGNVQLPSAIVRANLHDMRAAIDAAMEEHGNGTS